MQIVNYTMDTVNKRKTGDLLCVNKDFYSHVGVADGQGMVYENQKNKGVRYVSEETFSANGEIINLGILPNSVHPSEIIRRAKNIMNNQKYKYDVFSYNCEHFVRDVCGVDIKSPQVQKSVFSVGALAVAVKSNNPAIQMIAGGAAFGSFFSSPNDNVVKNVATCAGLGFLLYALFK